MHYSIIVVSNEIKKLNTNLPYYIINKCTIIDEYSLNYNDEVITFDYLLFDNFKFIQNLNIEMENNFVITNYNLQTSIENFFAFGEIVKSSRDKYQMLDAIIEFIIDPEIF